MLILAHLGSRFPGKPQTEYFARSSTRTPPRFQRRSTGRAQTVRRQCGDQCNARANNDSCSGLLFAAAMLSELLESRCQVMINHELLHTDKPTPFVISGIDLGFGTVFIDFGNTPHPRANQQIYFRRCVRVPRWRRPDGDLECDGGYLALGRPQPQTTTTPTTTDPLPRPQTATTTTSSQPSAPPKRSRPPQSSTDSS